MNVDNIRICRIASFPTEKSPGTGLPGYYLCKALKSPTLFLTRKTDTPLEVPTNVKLVTVRYPSPAFGRRIGPVTAVIKFLGLLKFLLASIGPLIRFRPDIVHIHSPLYLLHALFARLVLGSRICMTFHGSDLLRIKRSWILKRFVARIADLYFYVSISMRTDLEEFIPSGRLIHTPNGVDTTTFRDLGLKREKRVTAVGNLRWQKGYEYLIDAFSMLDHNGYSLVIVGDGPLRGDIQRRIDDAGLGARITLLGRKDHGEIADILNRSSIFVMSSVSEGFPKALVEAIASGLPVVTTDVGCCRELSNGVGLCVKPADADGLAGALDKLIRDDDMRNRFSQNTASAALRYSWDVSCETVGRAYGALISGGEGSEAPAPAHD